MHKLLRRRPSAHDWPTLSGPQFGLSDSTTGAKLTDMDPVRLVFFGSAGIACPTLDALVRDPRYAVQAVVTQPDRPCGRHLQPTPCPVKELAQKHGLCVYTPENPNSNELVRQLQVLAPELIVVAAYGHILGSDLLTLPKHGCINVHASLLPKYRGAAPVQWAIINDEQETGVTIMLMDAGLDTGPILATARTPILPTDTAETLLARLGQLGATLLLDTIPAFVSGRIQPVPQPPSGVSYAPKIKKEHGLINWCLPARAIFNRVRAFIPWPTAYTFFNDPHDGTSRMLKIWRAEVIERNAYATPGTVLAANKAGIEVACGKDTLRITELQVEGGRRMTAAEFVPGRKILPGMKLGGT